MYLPEYYTYIRPSYCNGTTLSTMLQELLSRIDRKEYSVGVIGLGYVGLPLMWTFYSNGMPVLGFDIDKDKIQCLQTGTPYIKHLGDDA